MHSAEAERDLGHLKRLLLVDERRQIDALRREVSALDERLGSDNRFSRAVANSLVVALKVAEVEQHRELAGVMAPIVVAGIRQEIAESKDIMVGALYPIVGRLVTTAVAQALRQLAEDVNRRIESVLSPRSLRLRLKALLSRRPLAELLLVEASQDRIDTLLLLDPASGAVLASSAVRDGRIEAEARATDGLNLLGGLMAAIIEFANHALSDVGGELRTLDFGGRTVLLRASPRHVVAAIGHGPASAGLGARVDEAFLAFLEGPPDDVAAALATMHGRFLALRTLKPWNRRVSALTLLGPAFVALIVCGAAAGWFALRERGEDADAMARITQAPEFAGYPVRLAIDRDRGMLTASALLPDPAAASTLRQRIAGAFPDLRIEERVAVLSDSPAARQTRAALSEGEALTSALRERLDTLSAGLERLNPSLEGLEAGRKRDEAAARDALAALTGRIERIERETGAPLRERLDTFSARLDGLGPSLEGLETGQKQDAAASRDALAALAGRIERIERETATALSERPHRTEVAQASAAQAAALREQLNTLSARLDGLGPALEGLEAGQKQDAAAARDALATIAGRIERLERETEAALSERPHRTEVAQASAAQAAPLREQLNTLSARLDGLGPALEGLEAGRKQGEAAARDALAALTGRIDRIGRETGIALSERALRAEVAQGGAAATARLDALSARLDTPRRHLLDTIERTAIFFKDEAVYRDPAKAAAALQKLAEALRAEPGGRLRVVGFVDSLGTAKTNLKVGRLRAEKVAADLVQLGIEPARLRVVATAVAIPVSDDVGAASANRRVTFEPIFSDE